MGFWTTTTDLPVSRKYTGATMHNGLLYVFGGDSGGGWQTNAHKYDPSTNAWTALTALPAALDTPHAHSDGTYIWLTSRTGATYRYDPVANSYLSRSTDITGSPADYGSLLDSTGRLVTIFKYGLNTVIHRYDPTANSWTTVGYTTGATTFAGHGNGLLGSDGRAYLNVPVTPGNLTSAWEMYAINLATLAAVKIRYPNQTSPTRDWPDSAATPYNVLLAADSAAKPLAVWHANNVGTYWGTDRYNISPDTWSTSVVTDVNTQIAGLATHEPGPGCSVAWASTGEFYLVTYDGAGGNANAKVMRWAVNTPPSAATLTSLTGGVVIDRAAVNRASHTFSDIDVGDSQSKFDLRYRLVGSPTWTTITQTTTNLYYDFPANSLAAGNYERQVLVYDSTGTPATAWSASGFFTAADAPGQPTITAPLNGSTVGVSAMNVTWSAPAQTDYQVQILDAALAVVYDSGTVTSAFLRQHAVTFPVNGVTRTVQVRVKNNGLWSTWAQSVVTVSYTPPATPTIVVAALDEAVIGMTHVLQVTITQPAPTGTQPVVNGHEVWVREVGDTSSGTRLAASQGIGIPFVWREPAKRSYEVRVNALGVNNVNAWSVWVAAPALTIKGVLVHDPRSAAGTIKSFRMNDTGAKDAYAVDASLITTDGREAPIVEFSEHSTRQVDVATLHSKAGEAAALRALVARRSILCYRDAKGRKVFGLIAEAPSEDTFYGETTSLSITEVAYVEAV
jgi:hypothetical protein